MTFEKDIANAEFLILGAFAPKRDGAAVSILLIGNAGPAMFEKFAAERNPRADTLDDWTRETLSPIARDHGADVVFPFDRPAPPFITWAREAGIGHSSPLGMMIHPQYGLWFAFRAAFLFESDQGVTELASQADSPCDTCPDKPCLTACPVGAFQPGRYEVETCRDHVRGGPGAECYHCGCLARRACPVGRAYIYEPRQHEFHMRAFVKG